MISERHEELTTTTVQNAPARRGADGLTITRPTPTGPGRPAIVQVLQKYALLVALALLVVMFSVLRPTTFFTPANLTTTLGIQAAAALLVLGVTVVLLAGEFDLSLASVMGLSASVIAYLTTQKGTPVLAACALVLVASLVIGLLNAFFVVRVGINSFIVTLGCGTLVQGVAIGLAGSTTIGGVPDSLTGMFQGQWLGIQRSFFYMVVVAALFYVALGKMPLGRSLFFTGNARTAAALAGVRTERLRTGALVTSSLVAGCAGIMIVGQTGAASPTIAAPYLLPAYAAAYLGATAFTPGRFNVWGSLWAVYLLAVGTTGFQLLGLENWIIDFFNGAVLILAVAFSRIFDGRRRARGGADLL
jgi:ribose transport system permease protein